MVRSYKKFISILVQSSLFHILSLSEFPSYTFSCTYLATILSCNGLNTTTELLNTSKDIIRSVLTLEISESHMKCLEWRHFSIFQNLQEIKIVKSELEKVMCVHMGHNMRHKKMRYLRFLSLSFSILHELDSSISRLHHLESIDFSHNNIHIISCDFQNLKSLKYLDISNNNVDKYLNQKSFESLPSSLSFLDLTGNPWTCSPSLSWLYTWSLKRSPTIQSQLNLVQCRVPNSHQMAPLLQAMEYYTTKINPFCPERCFCTFYHFPSHLAVSPSYTVLVNCSRQGITTFPTLPKHTTILDLSHNKLSDSSFEYLKFEEQNYEDITGLILSHNQITTIHPMLTKMKLHRMFKADHNRLKVVPYDFSLLLQSFAKIKITLADNRWECRCNAEIVSLVRERIKELFWRNFLLKVEVEGTLIP